MRTAPGRILYTPPCFVTGRNSFNHLLMLTSTGDDIIIPPRAPSCEGFRPEMIKGNNLNSLSMSRRVYDRLFSSNPTSTKPSGNRSAVREAFCDDTSLFKSYPDPTHARVVQDCPSTVYYCTRVLESNPKQRQTKPIRVVR